MPYKNILWIKLEKRLLNDYRFYTLPEDSQLIYVKLLMASAETENKIPKNPAILRECLRTKLTEERLELSVKEIREAFPKLKEKAQYYYFSDWDYSHNLITKGTPKELPGNSQGTPKERLDKTRLDKTRLDKKREEPENVVDKNNSARIHYELDKTFNGRDKKIEMGAAMGAVKNHGENTVVWAIGNIRERLEAGEKIKDPTAYFYGILIKKKKEELVNKKTL